MLLNVLSVECILRKCGHFVRDLIYNVSHIVDIYYMCVDNRCSHCIVSYLTTRLCLCDNVYLKEMMMPTTDYEVKMASSQTMFNTVLSRAYGKCSSGLDTAKL